MEVLGGGNGVGKSNSEGLFKMTIYLIVLELQLDDCFGWIYPHQGCKGVDGAVESIWLRMGWMGIDGGGII